MSDLSDEEKKFIADLRRIKVPDSLWCFADGGSLAVLRKGENGEPVMTNYGGVDQDYIVASIDNFCPDGGGW